MTPNCSASHVAVALPSGTSDVEPARVFLQDRIGLHSEPIAPSRRLSGGVPPDVESVIMSCLRKQPDERPRDARTLREDLRHSTMAPVWTSEQAAAWWRMFRESPATAAPAAGEDDTGGLTVEPEGLTVTVDIARR